MWHWRWNHFFFGITTRSHTIATVLIDFNTSVEPSIRPTNGSIKFEESIKITIIINNSDRFLIMLLINRYHRIDIPSIRPTNGSIKFEESIKITIIINNSDRFLIMLLINRYHRIDIPSIRPTNGSIKFEETIKITIIINNSDSFLIMLLINRYHRIDIPSVYFISDWLFCVIPYAVMYAKQFDLKS